MRIRPQRVTHALNLPPRTDSPQCRHSQSEHTELPTVSPTLTRWVEGVKVGLTV